ncbi:MAG: acyl carrier protein [Planctomycetales bacterium]|nr:acyl carrier protein [Planctomycetales bacterium]
MSNAEPISKLIDFIQTELVGDASEPIPPDADLLGSGRIDSMGIMRLVAFVESEFQISVPPEDVTIDHFESPRTIAFYIQSSIAGGD